MVSVAPGNNKSLSYSQDLQGIIDHLRKSRQPGDVTELRVFGKTGGVMVGGYFDYEHIPDLAKIALQYSGKASGIYVTVNLPDKEVLHRAFNKALDHPGDLTKNTDIIKRIEIPVDVDPKRLSGISATNTELQAANDKIHAIDEFLQLNGIRRENRSIIHSGNGAHLKLCVALPENTETLKGVKNILQLLAVQFDDDVCKVDQTVSNAARVIKLPYTMVCKGDNTSERPHRKSLPIDEPETLEPVPLDILQALAAGVPDTPKPENVHRGNGHTIDFPKWAAEHGVTIRKESEVENAIKYTVDCPFNSDHNQDSPAVFQYTNGALKYKCFHDSCVGNDWKAYRKHYEPNAYENKNTYQNVTRTEASNNNPNQTFPLTDMGNAERLFAKYGDIFRWVTERQLFILWNGHVWEYDTADNTQMLKLAKAIVRNIPNEPVDGDEEAYGKLLRWALASESGKHKREMIDGVKSEGNTTISVNNLDKDIYLFNCQNVTIDLHTGKARQQSRDNLITIMAPVDYDPAAKYPKWMEFLNLIQANNKDIITYLQKICGYSMTGDTKTDIIPFCYGIGGNGKSTFWGVIRGIMGAYAKEVDPDVFLVNGQKFKDSGQREELANLYGKRLVTATEIQEGRQLTIHLLKAISGGESIHGDRKYEHAITFKPTFKVILSGNNEPIVKDNTNGAWRRLKKIPFIITILNQIDGFEDTFKDEMSGILNWMIEGCLLWQSERLKDPEAVINATAEYRKDQDLIAQFLDDCCTMEPEAEITKKDFKAAYLNWCTSNSIKAISDKELKQRLAVFNIKDGFNSTKTARMWKGVKTNDLSDTTDTSDSKNIKIPYEGQNRKNSKENPVRSCPSEDNYGQDNGQDPPGGISGETLQKNLPADILQLWVRKGRPIIHLGPGENCEDLEKMLKRELNERHTAAINEWYEKNNKEAI